MREQVKAQPAQRHWVREQVTARKGALVSTMFDSEISSRIHKPQLKLVSYCECTGSQLAPNFMSRAWPSRRRKLLQTQPTFNMPELHHNGRAILQITHVSVCRCDEVQTSKSIKSEVRSGNGKPLISDSATSHECSQDLPGSES